MSMMSPSKAVDYVSAGAVMMQCLSPCARRRHHVRSTHHLPDRANIMQKAVICLSNHCFLLVGEGGFEPPKSLTTDLQSAPFGHSGILPYISPLISELMELVDGLEPPTC